MAVNLGGNLLASAVTGIDEIFRSRSYDFSQEEQETLYMNQFCSYSEIQKDINDYLGLSTREEELEILSDYIDQKIESLNIHCPECMAYTTAWNTREKTNKIISLIEKNVDIITVDLDTKKRDYTRCKEIHRALHTEDSAFKRFIEVLKNYKNPLSSKSDNDLIDEVVMASSELGDVYPPFRECVKLRHKDKVEISHDFNNLMRDEILPLNRGIFSGQLNTFLNVANKKYKNPLGDYIQKSLDRKKWINKEKKSVHAKLNDPNYSVSAEKIREVKQSLATRFTEDTLPDYLSFLAKRNLKEISNYTKLKKKLSSKMIRHYGEIYGRDVVPSSSIADLNSFLQSGGHDNRVLLAEIEKINESLKLALDQTKTFHRYCEFIKYMMNATPETDLLCIKNRKKISEKYLELANTDQEAKEKLSKCKLWKKDDLIIQTSRVSEYSDHIHAWNNRGDERWCLKNDTRPICK